MKRLVLLTLLACLCTSAGAQARPFTEADQQLYYQAIAFWGEAPHCDEVQAEVLPVLPEGRGGEATQPAGWEHVCIIHILESLTASECVELIVMEHEVGHLTGHGHSADPNSVMDPENDLIQQQCTPTPAPLRIPPPGTYAHWELHHNGGHRGWLRAQRWERHHGGLARKVALPRTIAS